MRYQYFTLLLFFFLSNNLYAQHSDSENEKRILFNDFDIFTFKPFNKKKSTGGKIYFLFGNEKDLKEISASYKKNRFHYSVLRSDSIKVMTLLDTSTGVYQNKNLFDTIIVKGDFILYQRKLFTKDREFIRVDLCSIKILENGFCDYTLFDISNNISLLNNVNSFATDNFHHQLSNYPILKKTRCRLVKKEDVLYFNNRSIFWNLTNFFLEFYLEK